jgi:two-component system response regulator FixJ
MALIIIVDDDLFVRSSLENLLESAGYDTTSLASGEEFLAQFPTLKGVCLILDVKMTGMSGLEVQQQLKALDYKTPVIFLSAHSSRHTRQKALSAGAFAFISKPVDEEVLLDTIARAISAV